LTRYFTGEPCKHNHVAERSTVNATCIACQQQYQKANREKYNQRNAKYRKENPEKARDSVWQWYTAHRDYVNGAKERWDRTNPEKRRANRSIQRANQRNATPPWLTKEHLAQMAAIHEQAMLCTQLTGVKHDVDHIEPLRGKDRCGLHVPWNLQILTAIENCSKSNRTT
jgi:hypothetical protein